MPLFAKLQQSPASNWGREMGKRVANLKKAKAAKVIVEHVDEIVLAGKKVQVRGQDLPLDAVQLDPTNPRVANTIAVSDLGTGAKLQQGLHDQLWSDSDVHDLYRSVLANKGLIER